MVDAKMKNSPPKPTSPKRESSTTGNSPTTTKQQPGKSRHHAENAEESSNDGENESGDRPQVPTQKRRRVTRACDECRRKKIKCDGKQPCTHCTVYSYECTYDQPSNRRRNPAPQYIEALEQRLQKAEAILRAVLPGVDIEDPKFDAHGVDQIIEKSRSTQPKHSQSTSRSDDDAHMQSMVDRAGSLDLDDTGNWDYHGHSSGYIFMRKFRAKFGDSFPDSLLPVNPRLTLIDSPKSIQGSPFETTSTPSQDLPPREVAIDLCRNAIDDCCALQRPIHRPTFFRRLHALYDTDVEHYTNEHIRFMPLLYVVMALGSLFARSDEVNNNLDSKGYKFAVEQGYQYFNTGKSMIDITDCRDLLSIQTVSFMILFLQGTAKLATCYAYVGVALRGCCRLGLHRKIAGNFNAIEQEERKRLFWQVRKMDIYVGTMLGLPQMLSDDDIDQEYPLEVDDQYISEEGINPPPNTNFPLIKASNAHGRLMKILRKVIQYVYPVKPPNGHKPDEGYTIRHSLIRELERELQQWMDELPLQLRPSENDDLELSRVQQLLRMAYAYVQMMIYRPFLHYVSQACQTGKTDKRSFACAAACVSVARNIVHITTEMRRRGLLVGSYWFVMYTTYFAILSLVYFVLENPDSVTSKDILRDAMEGRDTLASLAKRSMAADRCSQSLSGLFEQLPDKLKERKSSLSTTPNQSRKRSSPNDAPFVGNIRIPAHYSGVPTGLSKASIGTPTRARTLPNDYLAKIAKRNSMPDPGSATGSPFPNAAEMAFTDSRSPSINSTVPFMTPPTMSTPETTTLDFGTPALVHGTLPDLKNVMFPGDNPFAYPNQPISTLEENQFSIPTDGGFGGESFTSTFDTPSNMSSSREDVFDSRMPNIERQPSFNHPFQSQRRGTGNFYNNPNLSDYQEGFNPLQQQQQAQAGNSSNNLGVPGTGQDQDYWSHGPGKGQFKTGLTPGGPGMNLNLEEIFGGSQGWGMSMGIGLNDDQQMSGLNDWNTNPADQPWQ